MKIIVSLIFITIFAFINVNATEEIIKKKFQTPSGDVYVLHNQDTGEVELSFKGETEIISDFNKLNNDTIKEILKKYNINENQLKIIKKKQENKFNILTLKPFIFLAIIIIAVIISLNKESPDQESNTKPKKSKNKNQSRIDEFIEKSNDKNKDKERNDEFLYDDESYETWDTDDFEEDLKIKVEEKIHEKNPYYFVSAFGKLNFNEENFKSTEKENDQAKFTVYAFDITDKDNEIVLQGLIDQYKDENLLLSLNRKMEVKSGYGYFEWTPIFLFPKSIIVPPYRGERKIKFVVNASKVNAKFEQGKITNKKDFYFLTETILDINFQDPGYLEEDKYEDEVNEKIVQLGLAIAYSENEINHKGVETIKSWINEKVIWKSYLSENTEEESENKIKYSFLLKNTYELLKNKKLSLSEMVKELNYKSNISKRYDTMNLLLNIAGSDDRLSTEEDKLLNKTARALELDMDRFQQMKTSTIANIDTIADTNEENEDTIFNFSSNMTNEDKCKKLRKEYTRWNSQTNNSNEKIRNQARKMVELTANLRKKYNC